MKEVLKRNSGKTSLHPLNLFLSAIAPLRLALSFLYLIHHGNVMGFEAEFYE
jgi:hypothetical protein